MDLKKTVEASFPSSLERIAASALLLLSSSPSKKRSRSWSSTESYGDWRLYDDKSSGGSSSEEYEKQSASPVPYVSWINELKLKVVRKKRSKTIWIPNGKNVTPVKPKLHYAPAMSDSASEITTADTSSCWSSSSSTESYNSITNGGNKQPVVSNHMVHQAEAILRVLSDGSASEVRIRELLGDSPTTSKALRMLLRLEKVKRQGAGGRTDPFIYMKA